LRDVITVLYDDFETLDVFGPIEVFGRLPEEFSPRFFSMAGGIIRSTQNVPVMTEPLADLKSSRYILFIPGGIGARDVINDREFIAALKSLAANAEFVITVCTGSILLSRTGILDGKRATSNKMAFAWTKTSPGVTWIKKARWIRDGTIYTSSGVSAGTDMALGFIADQFGKPVATRLSREIEYEWNENPEYDPFADLYP